MLGYITASSRDCQPEFREKWAEMAAEEVEKATDKRAGTACNTPASYGTHNAAKPTPHPLSPD